jgi:hypothetical protein
LQYGLKLKRQQLEFIVPLDTSALSLLNNLCQSILKIFVEVAVPFTWSLTAKSSATRFTRTFGSRMLLLSDVQLAKKKMLNTATDKRFTVFLFIKNKFVRMQK